METTALKEEFIAVPKKREHAICRAIWGNTRVSQEAKRANGEHGSEHLL